VRADYQPGLHFKIPLVQQVMRFDKCILLGLDPSPSVYFIHAREEERQLDFYVSGASLYARIAPPRGADAGYPAPDGPIVKDALRHSSTHATSKDLIAGGREDIPAR